LLNNGCVKKELSIRSLDDLLFDGSLRDEAEDLDRLLLSNTMSTTVKIAG
jgi:hypothetical protein